MDVFDLDFNKAPICMTQVMLEDDGGQNNEDHHLFGDHQHPSWLDGAPAAAAAAALRPWEEGPATGDPQRERLSRHSLDPKDEETFEKLQKAMEIIRTTESHQRSSFDPDHCLIQVWFPDKNNRLQNQVVSTTTSHSDDDVMQQDCDSVSSTLSHFGERSKLFKFKVGGGLAEGLPGRVFVSGRPEMTTDVQQYGKENYLRIDEAVNCGIKAAVGIPIYLRENTSPKSRSLETVAVVEISKMSKSLNMESISGKLADIFESVDLYTWGKASPSLRLGKWPFSTQVMRTSSVLNTLTEAVCQVQGVLFAQVWGPCNSTNLLPSSKLAKRQRQQQHMDLLSCDCLPCGVQDSRFIDFRTVCTSSFVCEGQGIVGTAWKKNSSVWYGQISSIPEEENPYSAFDIRSFNGGVVAIPITLSKESEDLVETKYVMEIFLTELCANMEEQRRLIVQILSMLLNVGGGRLEIGVLLEYWSGNASCQRSVKRSMPLCSPEALERYPKGSSSGKGKGAVNEVKGKEGGTKKEPRTSSNKKAISMETLQQYFKYNLKEAARRLGVCPTTLKRVCRQYNIPRWPCRKLKKVNRSISKLQGVVESVPGVNATAIGFPDLKAACVFDTSVELSRGSQEQLSSGAVPKTTEAAGVGVGGSSPPPLTPKTEEVGNMGNVVPPMGSMPMQNTSPFSQPPMNMQMASACNPGSIPIPSQRHPRVAAYYDLNRMYASPPGRGGLLHGDESAAPLHHVGSNHSIAYLSSPPLDEPVLASASQTSGWHGQSSKGLSVKAAYKEGIMRFTLQPENGFDCIRSKLKNYFGLKDKEISLRYLDEEGDLISLKNDDDLVEAVEAVKDRDNNEKYIIRLQVETL